MASKRKSTTPCMIPPKTMALKHMSSASVGADHERVQPSGTPATLPTNDTVVNSHHNSATLSNGHSGVVDSDTYRCSFCSFGSQDVNQFLGHLDSEHRDFSKDPSFVCVQCSFLAKSHKVLSHHNAECHAEDASLIWNMIKQGSRVIVEQTSGDPTASQDLLGDLPEEGQDSQAEIIITKTPIMKIMKTKPEVKKIHMLKENASTKPTSDLETKGGEQPFTNGPVPVSQSTNSTVKSTHVVNGSIIGNVPVLQAGITQLVQLQQQQQQQQPQLRPQLPSSKSLPKVMIPLSSIPTYNTAMDSNSFLKNSFHKFPYPTKAELCYLTVVTKYPEEQLKIWFTAQRLKQGISWSPEEIEDARKKMFNTVIQSVPQSTITLLNTPLVASPGSVQHLIQASLPGHSVGKPEGASGVLVTQPVIANGLQGTTSSLAIAVTSIPKTQIAKPPTSMSLSSSASALKVVSTTQSEITACPNISSQFLDPSIYKNKKSYEQLSALKNSFCRNQFPGHAEVERLTKITGLSTRDVRKWFSDRRYHCRNVRGSKVMQAADNTIIIDSVPEITFTSSPKTATELISASAATPVVHTPTRRQSWHQTPDFSTTKYKERAPDQVKALEGSFAQNPFPPNEEVDRLRSETKMTRREIDSWFSERRKKQAIKETELQGEGDVEDSVEDEDSSDDLRASSENGSLDAASSLQLSGERKVSPIKINLKNLKVTEANGKNQLPGLSAYGQRESSPSKPPVPQKPRLSFKKTAQQRHLLKQLFVQTQRPTNEQYDQICSQTGLPRAEVIRWFGDSRYGLKNGNLRWFENYKHGIFPKGLMISSESGKEVLQDYFQKNKMLYEDDLPGLCEKTQMTVPQVRLWFAERLDEENRAISDTGSEDQSSSIGEPPSSQKGMYDAFSEVSENSESWEPGGQDGSSELGDAESNLPAVNFETD